MMKPLREQWELPARPEGAGITRQLPARPEGAGITRPVPDAVTARAVELLSAMPPLDTTKLRRKSLPPLAGQRVPVFRLRTAAVLAVLLGTAAAAAATVRSWPITQHAPDHAAPPTEVTPPVAPPVALPVPAATPAAEVPSAAEPARPPPATPGSKGPPREIAATEDESTLMVRAVRALRRDGDPSRAQTLAEQCLSRYPHGAQAEEAMALVMEAASTRGDAAGSQRAATAYLARFPAGRFADRAQRILASPAR